MHSVHALKNESNYCGLSDASLLGVRVALHVHWRWWFFVELALHVPAMGDILLADVATQVLNVRHSDSKNANRARCSSAALNAVAHETLAKFALF